MDEDLCRAERTAFAAVPLWFLVLCFSSVQQAAWAGAPEPEPAHLSKPQAAGSALQPVELGEELIESVPISEGLLGRSSSPFVTVVEPTAPPGVTDVGETLDGLLGVHVQTLGGLGKLATMSIRGSSGKQVAVFLDGIRLSGATGAVDLSDLPLSHFSRIEVLRGSASARFGDAAMGGVVNLVTPRGKTGTWGAFKLTGGLFTGRSRGGALDIASFAAHIGHGTEEYQVLSMLEGTWTNGAFLYRPDPELGLGSRDRERENNGLASLGGLLKGSRFLNETWELYGLASGFLASKEIPGLVSFPTPQAHQTDRRMLAALGLRGEGLFERGADLDGRLAFLGEEVAYRDPGGGTTGFPFTSKDQTNTVSCQLNGGLPVGELHSFSATLHLRHETFKGSGTGMRDRSTAFVSAGDTLKLFSGALQLTPRVGGELATGGSALGAASGGFRWEAFECGPKEGPRFAAALQGNAGTGFRRPTFFELYHNQGYYVGNPDLDPERSLSFDLGPVLSLEAFSGLRLRAEAVFFYTRYEDLIVYILQSGFRYKPFNVGKARAQGIELGCRLSFRNKAVLEADWTYNEVLDKTREETHRNRQIPGRPRNQVRLRLSGWIGRFRPFFEYHFVGRNPITRAGTKLLPVRNVINAGVAWKLREGLELQLTGKNLTDERAVDVRGFPLPSRAVYLSAALAW